MILVFLLGFLLGMIYGSYNGQDVWKYREDDMILLDGTMFVEVEEHPETDKEGNGRKHEKRN